MDKSKVRWLMWPDQVMSIELLVHRLVKTLYFIYQRSMPILINTRPSSNTPIPNQFPKYYSY